MSGLIWIQADWHSDVIPSTFSNISKTTGLMTQISYGDSLGHGNKVCSSGLGHMTKMVAMPIYNGKTPLKIFSRTRRLMTFGLGMYYWGCGAYQFCLFDLILNVPSTIFQLNRDGSSWDEPVLS